jgi:hypothetical protein
VRARAPLDVDLEDKLLYGLTPTRLAYLVLALLGAFTLWSSPWAPAPLRGFAAALVIGLGAAAAWGRWRGRALDAWFGDVPVFLIKTHRLAWHGRWPSRHTRTPIPSRALSGPNIPFEIVVVGRAPKAGASTIAAELTEHLAKRGAACSVRTAPLGTEHKPGPASALISVAAVDGGRVCYLDRGSGPLVAALIPEDDDVRRASCLGQATVVAYPDAAASKAFRKLAEVIVASAS